MAKAKSDKKPKKKGGKKRPRTFAAPSSIVITGMDSNGIDLIVRGFFRTIKQADIWCHVYDENDLAPAGMKVNDKQVDQDGDPTHWTVTFQGKPASGTGLCIIEAYNSTANVPRDSRVETF